jgi:hypothetical protein
MPSFSWPICGKCCIFWWWLNGNTIIHTLLTINDQRTKRSYGECFIACLLLELYHKKQRTKTGSWGTQCFRMSQTAEVFILEFRDILSNTSLLSLQSAHGTFLWTTKYIFSCISGPSGTNFISGTLHAFTTHDEERMFLLISRPLDEGFLQEYKSGTQTTCTTQGMRPNAIG